MPVNYFMTQERQAWSINPWKIQIAIHILKLWTEKMKLSDVCHCFFQVNTVECSKYNSPVMNCAV